MRIRTAGAQIGRESGGEPFCLGVRRRTCTVGAGERIEEDARLRRRAMPPGTLDRPGRPFGKAQRQ
jgi:hypothetical protein